MFYDGNYNGTGIDFKTGGTFIFDDAAIRVSEDQYRTYRITGDRIVIDKKGLNNVALSSVLEVREKEIALAKRFVRCNFQTDFYRLHAAYISVI